MKFVRIRIFLIVFLCAILLVAYVAKKTTNHQNPISTFLVLPSQVSDVSYMEITSAGKTICLKKNALWEYCGTVQIPANQKIVDAFLQVLTSERVLLPLSIQSQSWESHHLDDTTATKVILSDSDSVIIAELYFGMERFGGSEISVRSGRDISSWVTKNDISKFLAVEPHVWCRMELTPFSLIRDVEDGMQYASIVFYSGKKGYTLQRETNYTWSLSNHEMGIVYDVSNDRITEWLMTLSGARGVDIVVLAPDNERLIPDATITLISGRNETYVFDFYNTVSASNMLIKNREESWYYVISEWTKERLIPNVAHFLQ